MDLEAASYRYQGSLYRTYAIVVAFTKQRLYNDLFCIGDAKKYYD